jgi:hypothetical protein
MEQGTLFRMDTNIFATKRRKQPHLCPKCHKALAEFRGNENYKDWSYCNGCYHEEWEQAMEEMQARTKARACVINLLRLVRGW